MRRRRGMRRALGLVGIALLLALVWAAVRGAHQDWPWTPLDLGAPPGLATGPKLVGLADDFHGCRTLLDRAGVRYQALPRRRDGPSCGYANAVRFVSGGARRIAFQPAGLGVSCPMAAALAMWEWDVVQPAALRYFGAAVVAIDHFGSYNCRRIYGRGAGPGASTPGRTPSTSPASASPTGGA